MEIFVLLTVIALLLFIFYALIFIIIPLFVGASYEGTKISTMKKMIEFADVKNGERVVDLGSGDGRLLIAFAERGVEAHGYEINPFLVLYSRRKIRKRGLQTRALVHWKNFWKVDLSKFNVVTIFQVGYVMEKLERKLRRELHAGSRIVSNNWWFPTLKPKKIVNEKTKIYFYEV